MTDFAAVSKKYIFLRCASTVTGIANEKLVRNVCVNAVGQLARGRGGRRREAGESPGPPDPQALCFSAL